MIKIRAEFLSDETGVKISVEADTTTRAARMMEIGAISKYAHDQMERIVKEMDQDAVEMLGGEVD